MEATNPTLFWPLVNWKVDAGVWCYRWLLWWWFHSVSECLHLSPGYVLISSFLLKCVLESSRGYLSSCVPVIHVGDPPWIPGSWLWPQVVLAVVLFVGSKPEGGRSLFPSISICMPFWLSNIIKADKWDFSKFFFLIWNIELQTRGKIFLLNGSNSWGPTHTHTVCQNQKQELELLYQDIGSKLPPCITM